MSARSALGAYSVGSGIGTNGGMRMQFCPGGMMAEMSREEIEALKLEGAGPGSIRLRKVCDLAIRSLEAQPDAGEARGEIIGWIAPNDLDRLFSGYPATIYMLESNKHTIPLTVARRPSPDQRPERRVRNQYDWLLDDCRLSNVDRRKPTERAAQQTQPAVTSGAATSTTEGTSLPPAAVAARPQDEEYLHGLIGLLQILREYPDFNAGGLLPDAIDEALAGKVPRMVRDAANLRLGRSSAPQEAAPQGAIPRAGHCLLDVPQGTPCADAGHCLAASPAGQWVSVETALPERAVWVLVHNGKWTGVGSYRYAEDDAECWQSETREFIEHIGPKVTHWMPLPASPEPRKP